MKGKSSGADSVKTLASSSSVIEQNAASGEKSDQQLNAFVPGNVSSSVVREIGDQRRRDQSIK
jgi:hypothetical protein